MHAVIQYHGPVVGDHDGIGPDFLGFLYIQERGHEPAIAARLADSLEVSAPTVTNTLKRMARDGWVEIDAQKTIHLTQAGREAAASLIRRHMLTEWMLAKVLHVPWSQVHQEAHQIEHALSGDLENRLKTSLDDPQTCPHGNPLPGNEYLAEGWVCLLDVPQNQVVIIRRIHEMLEDHPDVLEYLEYEGVVPGTTVTVQEILPFNQTITVEVGQNRVSIGFNTAKYLFVELA